ncbi:CapA family protein [Proteus mirabilis]|nr:CapA family protein [Providencia stuartii]NMT49440.1 CapA family protein [Providencia stuartii]
MSKLLFIGDICTHGYDLNDYKLFKQSRLYNYLSNYNGYIIGNLEAPILNRNLTENNNKFSLLNPLVNKGFFDFCNVVTLSNNHIFDQGIDGYKITKNTLDSLGIQYIGAGENIYQARKPIILKIDKHNVALLAYNCYSTNSAMNADYSSFGTAPLLYDFIKEDIDLLKKNEGIDKVIILPHWGIENQFFPTAEQVCFARRLIDAGADAIIGTHTHTIQSHEIYNKKHIYYSIGNFIFNNFPISSEQQYYQSKFNKEGLLVELKIEDDLIRISEYYIKLDKNMLPEFCEIEALSTPIKKNNHDFNKKIKILSCKNTHPELSLSLRYNGKSTQIVYTSESIKNSISLNIETTKMKIKRLIIYRLRRLLK